MRLTLQVPLVDAAEGAVALTDSLLPFPVELSSWVTPSFWKR